MSPSSRRWVRAVPHPPTVAAPCADCRVAGELSLSAETHHSAGSHRVHAFTPPLSPVHSDAEGPDGSDGALAGGDDGDDGGDDDDDAVSSASTSTVRVRAGFFAVLLGVADAPRRRAASRHRWRASIGPHRRCCSRRNRSLFACRQALAFNNGNRVGGAQHCASHSHNARADRARDPSVTAAIATARRRSRHRIHRPGRAM